MSKRPRYELYMAAREEGLTYPEIAKKYGVSPQAVYIACAKRGARRFKPYTEKEVIYPNLRRWLNENEISRSEFARRMDRIPNASTRAQIGAWFRGDCYPLKSVIDKIIEVTGLSYEKLWEEESDD